MTTDLAVGKHNAYCGIHPCLSSVSTSWGLAPRFIYCASDGERVKVGSSQSPERRRTQLQRQRPRPVVLHRVWPLGAMSRSRALIVEGHVHSALGRRGWTGTEWYDRPLDDVLERTPEAISEILTWWGLRKQARIVRGVGGVA